MRDWIADGEPVDEVVRVDGRRHSRDETVAHQADGDEQQEAREHDLQHVPRQREREQRADDAAGGAERPEAEREAEVADAPAAEHEAADDRGGEDDEQRRRLGRVLREAGRERQERHHQRPAADAEEPGGRAGDDAERDQRDEERHAVHARTSIRTPTAARNRPKTSLSGRSLDPRERAGADPRACDRARRQRGRLAEVHLARDAEGEDAGEADRDDRAERHRVRIALPVGGPEDEQRDHDDPAAHPEQSREDAAGDADRDEARLEPEDRPAHLRRRAPAAPRSCAPRRPMDTTLASEDPVDKSNGYKLGSRDSRTPQKAPFPTESPRGKAP